MGAESVILLEKVQKIYYSKTEELCVMDSVDFSLEQGDFVVLIGPSGCGKSTFLNLVCGIDTPTSGSIIYWGTSLADLSERQLTMLRRQRLGMIFQSFELIPVMTVQDNIEYPLLLNKVPRTERRRRLEEIAAELEIGHLMRRPLSAISGGQKQRVAIARSLVIDPEVLLGDEITGNLDRELSRKVYKLLQKKNQENGMTFFLVTHDLEMLKYAKSAYTLEKGSLNLLPKEELV